MRIINKLIFSTQGRDGCKRGAALYVDNLDLTGEGGNGTIEWEAEPHASGIAGYSFSIDENPKTIANPFINYNTTAAQCEGLTGVMFAHVRTCDYAGNWGPTRTLRIDFGSNP